MGELISRNTPAPLELEPDEDKAESCDITVEKEQDMSKSRTQEHYPRTNNNLSSQFDADQSNIFTRLKCRELSQVNENAERIHTEMLSAEFTDMMSGRFSDSNDDASVVGDAKTTASAKNEGGPCPSSGNDWYQKWASQRESQSAKTSQEDSKTNASKKKRGRKNKSQRNKSRDSNHPREDDSARTSGASSKRDTHNGKRERAGDNMKDGYERKSYHDDCDEEELKYLRTCIRCRSENRNCMVCPRCKEARYCSSFCRTKDAHRHKSTCHRMFAFNKTAEEFAFKTGVIGTLLGLPQFFSDFKVSFHLDSVPDRWTYKISGMKSFVLLEISEAGLAPDSKFWVIKVRDVSNKTVKVLIETKETFIPLKRPENSHIASSLQKGNFLLLLDAHKLSTDEWSSSEYIIYLAEKPQFVLLGGIHIRKPEEFYDWRPYVASESEKNMI